MTAGGNMNPEEIRKKLGNDGHKNCDKSSCHRNVVEEENYCFWHIKVDNKVVTGSKLQKYGKNVFEPYLKEAHFTNVDLNGCNLESGNLEQAHLSNGKFQNANLRGTNLSGADLSEVNLRGANLSNADLSQTTFDKSNLSDANLRNADLTKAGMSEDNLVGEVTIGDFSGADLSKSVFNNTIFPSSNFKECNFEQAYIHQSLFDMADFRGSNLNNVDISDSKFRGSNLTEITLINGNITNSDLNANSIESLDPRPIFSREVNHTLLENSDLSNADIQDSSFEDSKLNKINLSNSIIADSNFKGVELSKSNLKGSKISNTRFDSANLDRINMQFSEIINSDFYLSDLSFANLFYSELNNCKLKKANVDGADFSEVVFKNYDTSQICNLIMSCLNSFNEKTVICGLDILSDLIDDNLAKEIEWYEELEWEKEFSSILEDGTPSEKIKCMEILSHLAHNNNIVFEEIDTVYSVLIKNDEPHIQLKAVEYGLNMALASPKDCQSIIITYSEIMTDDSFEDIIRTKAMKSLCVFSAKYPNILLNKNKIENLVKGFQRTSDIDEKTIEEALELLSVDSN